MSGALSFSARAYGGILRLYPSDLRGEFGAEMAEVFGDDLTDAWRSRGIPGVIGVWWCALCEVLRIALPGLKENPAFIVPVIAFLLSVPMQAGPLLSIRHALSQEAPRQVALVLICTMAVPSITAALTALVVVCTGKVSVVSLGLSCADGGASCSKSEI